MNLSYDLTPCVTVNGIEIEHMCAPVCSTAIPSCSIEQLSRVPLVTTPIDNNLTTNLLVGPDYHWSIVLPGGWFISGYTGDTAGDGQHLSIINDDLVEFLWDLDSVGLASTEVWVLGWFLVVVLFYPHLGRVITDLSHQLHAVWHVTEALVYSKHPREVAASSYLAIIFRRIASGIPLLLRSTMVLMQLSHQCWRWCRLW